MHFHRIIYYLLANVLENLDLIAANDLLSLFSMLSFVLIFLKAH